MQEIPNKSCGDGMSITSISKGTEWSPIRSVIIRVISRTTAKQKSDLLIKNMISIGNSMTCSGIWQ